MTKEIFKTEKTGLRHLSFVDGTIILILDSGLGIGTTTTLKLEFDFRQGLTLCNVLRHLAPN